MNKDRRNALYKIVNALDEKSKELEKIRDAEQDCYDNLPEGLVDSERGEAKYNGDRCPSRLMYDG